MLGGALRYKSCAGPAICSPAPWSAFPNSSEYERLEILMTRHSRGALSHQHSSSKFSGVTTTTFGNSASPAACLPGDILIYIFNLLRGEAWHLEAWMAWILVTHVCRRWRFIAIESAGLWDSVIFGSRRSWKPFVDRSQQAPLQVTLGIFRSADVQAARPVLQNLHRIKSLNLQGAQIFEVLRLPCLSSQAPLLEVLELSSQGYKRPHGKKHTKIEDGILSSLFAGSLSHLSRLELQKIPIRADSQLFSKSLTFLALKGCNDENLKVQMPLAGLIQVLHRLPVLEHLFLEEIFADPISSGMIEKSLVNIPVVHLASLDNICSFTEYPFVQKALMSRLSAPKLTMLGLGSGVKSREELAHSFVPPLASWTDDPNSFLTMDILEYPKYLAIYGGPTHALDEAMDFQKSGPFSVASNFEEPLPHLPQAVIDLCLQMPLHLVRSLQLFYATSPIDWAPVFVRMDSVEEIVTVITRWRDIFPVLMLQNTNPGIKRPFCPKLKKLKFLVFGEKLDSESEAFCEAFSSLVAARKENGIDLEVILDGEGSEHGE
ncbi:hypothetical protein DENSPDRAFT_836009 [Dentipellis sp. KUC8613]|nr:hypothetical protein DENSPDRAFT_836009 [Dentipellis sp. KUC8613]